MSTKIALATLAALLTVLAVQGTASALTYSHAAHASRQETNRVRASDAFGSLGWSSVKVQVQDRNLEGYPQPK